MVAKETLELIGIRIPNLTRVREIFTKMMTFFNA